MAVKFDVDYYDEAEKQKFSDLDLESKFKDLVADGLEIDELELLAIGLFNEQYDADGWRTRDDLRDRAKERLAGFRQYFTTEGGSLAAKRAAADMAGNTTELMGAAASLATMDKAFGFHAADWKKLPVGQDKDLDFEIASTGAHYVVVESKGAVVENVRLKDGLPGHKKSIQDKKKVQRPNRPNDVLVGTVTAIPQDPTQRARVLLVDPPAPLVEEDPFRFKVQVRLSFYRDVLRAIGRPHLLIALTNRLRSIASVSEVKALDGVPLVNADDELFGVPPSFLSDRSHSLDEGLVVLTTTTKEGILLVGLDLDVIPVIVAQQFDVVNAWRSSRSGRKRVQFILLLTPEELRGFTTDGQELDDEDRPRRVVTECDVFVSPAGIVLGELPRDASIQVLPR